MLKTVKIASKTEVYKGYFEGFIISEFSKITEIQSVTG